MIENLKDLKDIYEVAKQQLTRGKEPLDEFLKLNACLKAIVDDPQAMIFEKMDAEYRKFFFETLATGAIKSITREKSRDEKVSNILPNNHPNDSNNCLSLDIVPGSNGLNPGKLHTPVLGLAQAWLIHTSVFRQCETHL